MDNFTNEINYESKPWYTKKSVIITICCVFILFVAATAAGAYLLLKDRNQKNSSNDNVTPTPTATSTATDTPSVSPTQITYSRQSLAFDGGKEDGIRSFVISVEIPSNSTVKRIEEGKFLPGVVPDYKGYEIEVDSQEGRFSLLMGQFLEAFPLSLAEAKKIETTNFDSLYRVRVDREDDFWNYSNDVSVDKECFNGVEGKNDPAPCGGNVLQKVVNGDVLFFLKISCVTNDPGSLVVCDRIVASIKQ